ncbi:hypothetical protein F2P81_003413 [Scophthalmus maximus]|uniref:Uncharacterized protein n=1 Tax=Scophthalmus maximus TaxID=52904 RepID=A0A6A4TGD2_SCOMX|nr:hypothetical protein F2P81_003413 [Scophthalmus maximus]
MTTRPAPYICFTRSSVRLSDRCFIFKRHMASSRTPKDNLLFKVQKTLSLHQQQQRNFQKLLDLTERSGHLSRQRRETKHRPHHRLSH